MWKLKGCPRCNGDLLVYQNEYGLVENCLQCGFELLLGNEYKFAGNGKNREIKSHTLLIQSDG